MCDGHSDLVVDAPSWLRREGRYTVCLDGCIADVVVALWERGVVTLGSCCGHGKQRPSLVLEESQDPDLIGCYLRDVDDRDWCLMQWKLVEVGAWTEVG